MYQYIYINMNNKKNHNNCMCMKCQRIKRENHRIMKQKNTPDNIKLQEPKEMSEIEKKYNSDMQKAIKLSIEENNNMNNNDEKIEELDIYLQNMINNLSIDDFSNKIKVISSRKRNRNEGNDDNHNHSEKKSNTDNYNNTHIDFIVGRGREEPKGGLNIPINPLFKYRNVVFIDANSDVKPDIVSYIENIDLSHFGITQEQDPEHKIDIRFIFDWSSFFCGAIQGIHHISLQLRRPYEIYVPLTQSENYVPSDIKNILWQPIYNIVPENGKYPLFDWSIDICTSSGRPISDVVNPDMYLKIIVRKKVR